MNITNSSVQLQIGSIVQTLLRGRSETTFAQKGEGGQLGAILCKLFRLEVYIQRGVGGQES